MSLFARRVVVVRASSSSTSPSSGRRRPRVVASRCGALQRSEPTEPRHRISRASFPRRRRHPHSQRRAGPRANIATTRTDGAREPNQPAHAPRPTRSQPPNHPNACAHARARTAADELGDGRDDQEAPEHGRQHHHGERVWHRVNPAEQPEKQRAERAAAEQHLPSSIQRRRRGRETGIASAQKNGRRTGAERGEASVVLPNVRRICKGGGQVDRGRGDRGHTRRRRRFRRVSARARRRRQGRGREGKDESRRLR